MKILFVSSGRSGEVSPIIFNQAKSLEKNGCEIQFYLVNGKGVKGYLKDIIPLSKYLTNNSYDIIHAHYGLMSLVVFFAKVISFNKTPYIVSFMGSDLLMKNKSYLYKFVFLFSKIISLLFAKKIIVKSTQMKEMIFNSNKVIVIPNGVSTTKFFPMDKLDAKKTLKWKSDLIHILFAANPIRKVKNYDLFESAIQSLSTKYKIESHALNNIQHKMIPTYMNAADIVVLTSLYEGSPNVIKEALACNSIIVSTKVGDVEYLMENVEGCYLSDFDSESLKCNLQNAIAFIVNSKKVYSNGRNRIYNLDLDEKSVAIKILDVYKNILNVS